MRLQVRIEVVKHHAGLDGDRVVRSVEIQHVAQIFRRVNDECNTGCLAALAGAAAACEHGGLYVAGDVDGSFDVVCRFRNENTERNLLVDRGVGRVAGAVGVGEEHFALRVFAKAVG